MQNSRRALPDHWAAILAERGVTSLRDLSRKAGISHRAATTLVHGDATPLDETVAAIAAALELPVARVYELVDVAAVDAEVWEPPAESTRLTKAQRAVLNDLIRVMVGSGDRGD